MTFRRTLQFLFGACAICAAANASTISIFNFDGDSLGTATTFTDTANGLNATFSSAADPGGFVVYPSFFDTLTGNVLGDPGPAGLDNLALDVAFSGELSAVSLDFATSDFSTPSPLTLTAYQNSQLVGSIQATGTFLDGFSFPEGQLSFSGLQFNNIVISSTATDFAVDNIAATVTPEPGLFPLLALGFAAVAFVSLRAKSRTVAAVDQEQASSRPLPSLPPSVVAIFGAGLIVLLGATVAPAQSTSSIFPLFPPMVSTVPSNGDVNPYGVVIVPKTLPAGSGIQPGDILVSNFNNNENLQGLGTTIVRVTRAGSVTTFYTSSAHVGLTAALGVLSNGWVLIGNLPTADGTSATVQPGNISVLDRTGNFLGAVGGLSTVDGPWGLAMDDTGHAGSGMAHVFVSNVLSGVVSRFDLSYTIGSLQATDLVLANGFTHRTDPAALVLGPSGLAYDSVHNVLLVASSTDNAIYQIPNAATANATQSATLLFQDLTHLHGPLDLAILPNGHLLVANSDGSNADPNQPSELVEYTAAGAFLAQKPVDPNNGGAFGVATNNIGWGTFQMAWVDDNANTLAIRTTVAQ